MKFVYKQLIVLLAISSAGTAIDAQLPSFGETILKEQFPEYKESADVERGLRRYLAQLEYFRQEILEGYNRSILDFRKQLIDADSRLEIDRKKGRVDDSAYTGRHDYIAGELKRSQRNGDHMAAYYSYVQKYKAEIKWVNAEIAVEEKKKFKF
jgi:hypothetical protein